MFAPIMSSSSCCTPPAVTSHLSVSLDCLSALPPSIISPTSVSTSPASAVCTPDDQYPSFPILPPSSVAPSMIHTPSFVDRLYSPPHAALLPNPFPTVHTPTSPIPTYAHTSSHPIVSFAPTVTPPRIPLPDPVAFEEPTSLNKKQRRSPIFTQFTTPLKCPKTPLRTPQRNADKEKLTRTELRRRGSCSTHFEFLGKLGEGSFGQVFKVRKDGILYAIKRSKRPIWNTIDRNRQLGELNTIKLLGSHPNIIKLHDAWEEGGHIYIQTELCESGSIKDLLDNAVSITEESIWGYLADIAHGLSHVHQNGVMHLDVKPDNLLLGADNRVKIADFGISSSSSEGGTFSGRTEGDRVYMAPELLEERFSPKADIFSLGITIYEMATGYDLPGSGQLWRDLRKGKIQFPDDRPMSSELSRIIIDMMHPDPNQRPSAADVLKIPRIYVIFNPPTTPPADGCSSSQPPILSRQNSMRRKLFGS
eukprot:TRINITY_DN20295_c0_g1_i1.p1 TRINITY_DN20295_c0_g1~~TRINITY_DN20295_c0_g1_i1.p1  ORF type:complete len:477 (-),score=32.41 TRINITY_DN20295_c0_g1_i1:72-1502(-)